MPGFNISEAQEDCLNERQWWKFILSSLATLAVFLRRDCDECCRCRHPQGESPLRGSEPRGASCYTSLSMRTGRRSTSPSPSPSGFVFCLYLAFSSVAPSCSSKDRNGIFLIPSTFVSLLYQLSDSEILFRKIRQSRARTKQNW